MHLMEERLQEVFVLKMQTQGKSPLGKGNPMVEWEEDSL